MPPGALISVPFVCCQVEVSASGRSLVQRSLTEFGVSECAGEACTLRKSKPNSGCCAMEQFNV
jgi:hypothetical protein